MAAVNVFFAASASGLPRAAPCLRRPMSLSNERHAVLQGEDALRLTLDLPADGVRHQFLGQVTQEALAGLVGHDVDHAFPALADLRRLSVAVGGGLVIEADAY